MSTTSTTFPRIQSSQLDGRAEPFRYRQAQLHRLYESLIEAASTIKLAIQTDSFLTSTEVDFEFARALSELRTHYESLDFQRDLKAVHQIETGVENVQNAKPVGIVYIVPSRWTLTFSVLSALGAAVAAGSCVVVEVSRFGLTSPSPSSNMLWHTASRDTDANLCRSEEGVDWSVGC
jgi:acyl-CoA reductase-like NAD-dependent aldehyde dehydrogenase